MYDHANRGAAQGDATNGTAQNESRPGTTHADAKHNPAPFDGERGARQDDTKRGLFWPFFLAGLLVAFVIGDVVMVLIATRDPSFSVEENYYKKGLELDQRRAQERRNAELGWQLSLDVKRIAESLRPVIRVAITGRDRKPISDAKISLVAFHNARAAQKLRARLEFVAGHYVANLPIGRAGLWEFRFVVEHGGQRFTQTIRRKVEL